MPKMFNDNKFMAARFSPRRKKIKCPELIEFFDVEEGQDPEIEIHGLTGEEMAKVRESAELNHAVPQIAAMAANAGGNAKEIVKTILEYLGGIDRQLPNDYVVKLAFFRFGTGFSQEFTNKFAMAYPTRFMIISNEIAELTGQGHVTEGK